VDWFAVKRGRLEYRGRISRQPFETWCTTEDGQKAIARVAKGLRFSILGRKRSARRQLWRALDSASRTDAFRTAIAAEPDRFMQVLADVCYADALPRAQVGMWRLVLAPRALVAGRARAAAFARLMESPALADIDEAVRKFLLDHVVIEMDAAIKRASPVPKRPVLARDGWACVGVRLGTVWMDPLWAGPDGTGHLFMYEMPPQGLTRRDAKAVDAAIEQIGVEISTLSRATRDAMIRSAALRGA
jgi:hypothetical protein